MGKRAHPGPGFGMSKVTVGSLRRGKQLPWQYHTVSYFKDRKPRYEARVFSWHFDHFALRITWRHLKTSLSSQITAFFETAWRAFIMFPAFGHPTQHGNVGIQTDLVTLYILWHYCHRTRWRASFRWFGPRLRNMPQIWRVLLIWRLLKLSIMSIAERHRTRKLCDIADDTGALIIWSAFSILFPCLFHPFLRRTWGELRCRLACWMLMVSSWKFCSETQEWRCKDG